MTLDSLPIGQTARIAAVDWAVLAEEEGQRLRALGWFATAVMAAAVIAMFALL